MKRLAAIIPLVFLLLAGSSLQAQNVGINITTPDSTAILHLEATNMGFLPPRMTEVQRDAINNPAMGLMIFNTTDSTLDFFNGNCWVTSFQRNCNDCFFDFVMASTADTIDRVVSDSLVLSGFINQTAGAPQNIAFAIASNLPPDLTVSFNNNPAFSSGPFSLTFHTTPFTPAGTYPIVIQGLCGSTITNFIYSLTILPCYYIDANNSVNNYEMGPDLYATYPNLAQNQPVCVVCEVKNGVTLTSSSTNQAAFSTNGIPAGSYVAILNNGNIFGEGGDGGIAFDPTANPPMTGEGEDGGDAVELTIDAQVQNNGYIFSGGGGGNAMAFRVGIQLGPVFLGALIGAGGGGSPNNGLGGNTPTIVGLSFYSPGVDATSGLFGVPGAGGLLNFPIPITIGPVNIQINPNVRGGDGGPYGYPGTVGTFTVTLNATLIINVPFIGPVPIPIVTNLNIPIPIPPPPAGDAGFAIRRNGNNTNIQDNTYNTSFLKGEVGN